jgi:PKD repeat protein
MRFIGTSAVVAVTLVFATSCSGGSDCCEPEFQNQAPVAKFEVPPCVIDLPCDFTNTSTDDVAVTRWSWDLNGDNTEDASTATASYRYTADGSYNVSLTVYDVEGLSHTKTSTLTIDPLPTINTPPTASFTYACDAAVCSFVSTSTDLAPGSIATYAWTFGDGGTAAVSNPSHSYGVSVATDFTVTLTVTDNEGATAVATQTVNVDPVPPVNTPPTAGFTYACNAAACSFASTSTDAAPGTIASYAWTFGDGATANLKNPSHSYTIAAATDFTVTLTVRDNQGATAVASQTITVDPVSSGNIPPTASFTPWCYGEGCMFISTSTDAAPGTIATYAWTFGDGATEDWKKPSHVYSITGRTTFTVTLTVTDNEGASAVATRTVTLTPLPPAVQGCTTSGKIVECVLDIPANSTLKTTLLGLSCDLAQKLSTPPPVGDQLFIDVCHKAVGNAIGIFGGEFDELWVYQAGSQARIWFTQGDAKRPLNPPEGRLSGTYPDWTISIEDGDHPGAPGEPDFTDIVFGVKATAAR